MKKTVVGIGEIVWDVFDKGATIGGAPANFAFHAGQFGYKSCAVSAVGNDELGSRAVKELEHKGLNLLVEKVDNPTGVVMVTTDETGNPYYDIREESAWDYIPFTDAIHSLAERTDAVCFGTLGQRSETSRSTIKSFLTSMRKDALKVFDINLRQHYYDMGMIADSLRMCNILKINNEEMDIVAAELCPGMNGLEACRELADRFDIKVVLYTLGSQGSMVVTDDTVNQLKADDVRVESTVGAGDSFTAAFVASYLKDGDPVKAHGIASETAAFVCGVQGAMPSLPFRITHRARPSILL